MSMVFFTYRSGTSARNGLDILRREAVSARMDRTPAQLARFGCGYGLWVPPHQAKRAATLLRERGAVYERCYRMSRNGFQEVTL